jgi:UDP-N-acetylglucosamine 4,6-dehydratase/5-epimerase
MSDHPHILITGATGTVGQALVAYLLNIPSFAARFTLLSRDEYKQHQLRQRWHDERLHWQIADIRDRRRVRQLFDLHPIDTVIHAAALKHVPFGELYPTEFIETNIEGTRTLIEAAQATGTQQFIGISTSKAVAPVNLYGATKLIADKLILAANSPQMRSSIIRCGNIWNSRGSVVPTFLQQRESGTITVTHPEMTRFSLDVGVLCQMVGWLLQSAQGGEILIPKSPTYRVADLAQALAPEAQADIVGLRPGEKLHEELILPYDAKQTLAYPDRFITYPQISAAALAEIARQTQATTVGADFYYASERALPRLTVAALQQMAEEVTF